MFRQTWAEGVAQDIYAMKHARTWTAVESIRRGMQDLGRWTGGARRAYAEACVRFSEPNYHSSDPEGV